MRQSTIKALNYAKQIRRNQRNQIIMQLRSKILESENSNNSQHIQEEKTIINPSTILDYFNQRLPNTSDFHKIIQILVSITNQYKRQRHEGKTCYHIDILEYIFACSDQIAFRFQFTNLENVIQSCEFSILQLKEVLARLPKLIKQLLQQININLTRLKNFIIKPQNIREYYSILRKIQQCRDIKLLNVCLGTFLQAYHRVLCRKRIIESEGNIFINYEVVEIITNCLIQATCFKPRFLKESASSQQVLLIFKAINDQMIEIRNTINGQICNLFLSFIQSFNQIYEPLSLFNNYIYIIGNAFISLNAEKSSDCLQKYCQNHRVVLNKFGQTIKQILERIDLLTAHNQSSILEVCSLVIWFIRNEILIHEGMFNVDKNIEINSSMANIANQYWLHIIFGILSVLKALFIKKYSSKIDQTINEGETNLLVQALSLLQLLYFDFSLAKPNLQEIINWLNFFKGLVRFKAKYHNILHKKLYQFYLILACSLQKDQQMLKAIVYQASNALKQWPLEPNGIQFCCKLLHADNRLPIQYKTALFEGICNLIDGYLQQSIHSDNYETSMIMLTLLYTASMTQIDIKQRSFTIFELLNETRVRMILQLCSKVWQEEHKIENLIQTLEFLKFLSDKQQYTSMIKQIILRVGYYEQLQILSQNPSQQINRLVYQIYEILQIN